MNDGNELFSLGRNCLLSWGIKARTSDGHSIIDLNTNRATNYPKPIHISDKVWIGEDVKILKGSTMPSGCIVGSGSIVTNSFPSTDANTLIVGIPAKVIKRQVTWDRRMPHDYNIQN